MWQIIRTTFQEWQDDQAVRLAAALSYYTVFSLAPLLIIVISLVGLVIGQQQAQGQVIAQVAGYVGEESAGFIQSLLQQMSAPSNNMLATVIGFVTLLLGATGVFGELQASLNQIWDVPPKQLSAQQGFRALILTRVLSFGIVLAVGFLLLVSLVVSTSVNAVSQWVFGGMEVAFFGQAANFVLSFAIVTLLFGLIFKFLPDTQIQWRDVWLGAVVTAILFSIGRLLISLYLSHSSTASVYGAAGSLVVLLLWVYYSAQILFFGAEFTQVYSRRHNLASLNQIRKQTPQTSTFAPPVTQPQPATLLPGPSTAYKTLISRQRSRMLPVALAGATLALLFMAFRKTGKV